MAGLLDFFNSPDAQAGLGLLAAAGPRADGAGFGQRLQEGLGAAEQWKMRQAKMAQEAQQAKMQEMQMQQMQAQMANQQKVRELAQKYVISGSPALAPLMGDQSTGIMQSAGRPATQAGFDQRGYANALMQAGLVDEGRKELAMLQKENQINKLDVKDFSPASVQKFQQSGNYADLVRMDKAHFQNTGSKTYALDPYSGKPLNSIDNTQSPDSKASNQVAWANYGLQKANQDKPQYIESLGGFANPRTQQVMPARDMQGNVIEGTGKMTEDQAKASGWLVQAENAFKNMKSATAKDKSAAQPGVLDAYASIPSFGFTSGMANMMRGSERQNYMQGASSLSEALLRAATGAGVNKDEAAQKVKELTPQIGDSEDTIKQKEAAIPLYIESLKMRAGPGAKRVGSFIPASNGVTGGFGQTSSAQSDPLGIRGR